MGTMRIYAYLYNIEASSSVALQQTDAGVSDQSWQPADQSGFEAWGPVTLKH